MKSFEELQVWKSAMVLTKQIYRVTSDFPSSEQYGLTSQMRRAALSVPSNVAEGWGRGPGAANANFVRTARGSLYELRTPTCLAHDLDILPKSDFQLLSTEIDALRRLIHAYLESLPKSVVRESLATYAANGGSEPID